ncbi:tyrosine-type recombinase/integrase [Mameliella alba]|nr:tyrosine-type recombinase/integrase [Mameliella alba]MBY6168477.1 tyrosine-type recombinase/integrase [Mameliella alba]MBY6173497.1 tyrosine-type recombinase/integrase [Mameliella alba]
MKGLSQSGHWPSGNPRYYFRRAGEKPVPMPDARPQSDTFRRAWVAVIEGAPVTKSPAIRPPTGSIAAGVRAYMASDHFLSLAASTRATWRRSLEDIERRYGKAKLADLLPRHIRTDLARLGANPANNRLKIWRALGRYWVDAALREEDPAQGLRKRTAPATDGHTVWTDDDIAAFRLRWPIGSTQRLALELLVQTGAARIDVVALGPGMVGRDGWLTYRRAKSGSQAVVPWSCTPPDWFRPSPFLFACLEQAPYQMTWLCTAKGHTRSDKAFGSWFAKAARDADLPRGRTAHGIRKWRAVDMAERGATTEQRMAILGHESASEAAHYSKSAELKKIVSGTSISNFSNPVGKSAK